MHALATLVRIILGWPHAPDFTLATEQARQRRTFGRRADFVVEHLWPVAQFAHDREAPHRTE
jgi:hypothetical protein